MTRRGRMTVVLAIGFVLGMAVMGRSGWRLWTDFATAPEAAADIVIHPPGVSASPPTTAAIEALLLDPPRSRERFELARIQAQTIDPSASPRLVEWRDLPAASGGAAGLDGPVRVEYSLDEALTARIFKVLRHGRVAQGIAIVIDPRSGRLLSYVSTDEASMPASRAYPAASVVKVLTAAALLEGSPPGRESVCTYSGNKYRLNRRRLDPPVRGDEASLTTALASSNNQCFAQWALHSVGEPRLRETFERFGWLSVPAPGHEAGQIGAVETDLDLGRLGSGLDGARVTALHIAQLASILTSGRWVEPWWVDRVVDTEGRTIPIPARAPDRRVISDSVAQRLRTMMTATTKRGTARSAFQDRRGRARLGSIDVAGKTGNLSGRDPDGRYEWFVGLAPAENPEIGVVVLQLQGSMWWRRSTEIAADVLREVFCDKQGCRVESARRWTGELDDWTVPQRISELNRPSVVVRSD